MKKKKKKKKKKKNVASLPSVSTARNVSSISHEPVAGYKIVN